MKDQKDDDDHGQTKQRRRKVSQWPKIEEAKREEVKVKVD
jgi:hypothetical protein